MKFKLSVVSGVYNDPRRSELAAMGFKFKEDAINLTAGYAWIDHNHTPEIEIGTIEELVQFIDKNGQIIMDKDSISIYDGYCE